MPERLSAQTHTHTPQTPPLLLPGRSPLFHHRLWPDSHLWTGKAWPSAESLLARLLLDPSRETRLSLRVLCYVNPWRYHRWECTQGHLGGVITLYLEWIWMIPHVCEVWGSSYSEVIGPAGCLVVQGLSFSGGTLKAQSVFVFEGVTQVLLCSTGFHEGAGHSKRPLAQSGPQVSFHSFLFLLKSRLTSISAEFFIQSLGEIGLLIYQYVRP